MEILDAFSLAVGVAGTAYGLYSKYKADKRQEQKDDMSSLDLLYQQLEILRKKIISKVHNEVVNASLLAEQKKIIIEFREHCPDCYDSFLKKNPQYEKSGKIDSRNIESS